MNWFKSLRVALKINIITFCAILTSLIIISNFYLTSEQTNTNFKQIKDVTSIKLELSIEAQPKVNQIEELFTQFVAIGDSDSIDIAEEVYEELDDIMKSLSNLDNSDNAISLFKNIENYYSVSKELISTYQNFQAGKGATMEDVQPLVAKKSELFLSAIDKLNKYRENIKVEFNEYIDTSIENSNNSLYLAIIIAAIFAAVTLLLGFFISKNIGDSTTLIANSFKQLSEGKGDLNYRLPVLQNDEIGQASAHFNSFMDTLKKTVDQVMSCVEPLTKSSQELQQQMANANHVIDSQTEASGTVTTSMNELEISVNEISENAANAAHAATDANMQAEKSMELLQESTDSSNSLLNEMAKSSESIELLSKSAEDVEAILDVINNIADQTNLLALNAAIEAARAGEQGRGFAVVADEVRVLSQRTSDSTTEIRALLNALNVKAKESVASMNTTKEKTDESVEIIEKTNANVSGIVNELSSINDLNASIATATEEQSLVAKQVVENVNSLNNSFDDTRSILEDVGSISDQLISLSEELKKSTSNFSNN